MRKILVSAYACEPMKGSERAVGWNIVLQLARHNVVHVVTQTKNSRLIQENLPDDIRDNLHFHYYECPEFLKRLKSRYKSLIYAYYFLWQIGIISIIKKIAKEYKFDYSLHLTFGNVWLPTFLPFFKIPFIYGPVGGGESIPNAFLKSLPMTQRLIQGMRKFLKLSVYVNFLFMYTASKAVRILCRTEDTANLFPSRFQGKTRILTDGAIEESILKHEALPKDHDVVRVISTSRLIGFKNVISIVHAVHQIPRKYKLECTIVGNGPERVKIEQAAKDLKETDRIFFKRGLNREETIHELTQSDIFISPSLRDACNLSLLEAMAVGLPVICLNWSGMAISTDDTCAIRLPVSNSEQMPKDIAQAVVKLVENGELRERMGAAGRKRIMEMFNWESKGKFLEELLSELDENKR